MGAIQNVGTCPRRAGSRHAERLDLRHRVRVFLGVYV